MDAGLWSDVAEDQHVSPRRQLGLGLGQGLPVPEELNARRARVACARDDAYFNGLARSRGLGHADALNGNLRARHSLDGENVDANSSSRCKSCCCARVTLGLKSVTDKDEAARVPRGNRGNGVPDSVGDVCLVPREHGCSVS